MNIEIGKNLSEAIILIAFYGAIAIMVWRMFK